MYIAFLVLLFALGACLGSFLCCQARRLRSRHNKHHIKSNRSICLHCRKQLKWYDNIPILSWLLLKGKCRYCHEKIGIAEPISELVVGISFLLIGTTINPLSANILEWCIFISILVLVTILAFLAIYDGLYGELPTVYLCIAISLATITTALKITSTVLANEFSANTITNILLSVIVSSGTYLLLYKVSKGKWVGNGDWLLCIPLGLVLGNPLLAFVLLFIANLLACLIMYPVVRKAKSHKIYFGPFLVIAFVITLSISEHLLPLLYFQINL